MSEIPSDLWTDILKRVPAKKLFKLRGVCKSWNSLILSSSFIRHHNRHLVETTKSNRSLDSTLLASMHGDDSDGYTIVEYSCTITHNPDAKKRREFPHIPSYRLDDLLLTEDFVHGVALVFYFHVDRYEDKFKYLLWNPCINKHVLLPWTNVWMLYGSILGLGFDSGENDFKIVRSNIPSGSSYDVLTLREGTWRNNLPLPSCVLGMSYEWSGSCFLNGNIHWIVIPQRGGDYELLMFDCESEEFKTKAFPRTLISDTRIRCFPKLMLLDLGKGSMLAIAKIISIKSRICEVWVMEKYGGEWTQLDDATDVITAVNHSVIRKIEGVSKLYKFETDCHNHIYHFKQSMMLMDI